MATNPYLVDDLAEQVMYAGDQGAAEQSTFFMDVMDAVPGMGVAAATKIGRGSSTLTYGGRVDGYSPGRMRRGANRLSRGRIGLGQGTSTFVGDGSRSGVFKGGLSNLYYRPGNVRRFATRDYFNVTPEAGNTKYTPFYAASVLNAVPRAVTGKGTQKWFNKLLGGTGENAAARLPNTTDEVTGEMFSRGFTSRIASSAKIGAMSQRRFARNASSIRSSLIKSYASNLSGPNMMRATSIIEGASQKTTSQLMAMSGSGPLTSRMGAWVAASEGYVGGDTMRVLRLAEEGGGRGAKAAMKARETAVSANSLRIRAGAGSQKVGVGNSLMRAAGSIGKGTKGVAGANLKLAAGAGLRIGSRLAGPVGWTLLGYDISKLIGKTAARTVSTGLAGVASYTSPMRTGIMQQSFTDNEVTRTSRARGVQAISNSRLNARSVLGNESAAMAAYFG